MDEKKTHRQFAVDTFNHTWELLEKSDRTKEDEVRMLHSAHASRYHWGEVGNALNLTRGEWQISRVYSVLNRPEPALYHAQLCLDICLENKIGDFDLAFAYEALARASAITGNWAAAKEYITLALKAGEQISDADDRDYFLKDIRSIPGFDKINP